MTAIAATSGQRFPIVFTDLDGTLLDHNTYSYEPAMPALARLAELKVPVVLASSKTRAEMAVFQAELQFGAPMICENGGGIHWPIDWEPAPETEKVVSYHDIRQAIDGLAPNIRRAFSGFGDWSQDRLIAETGLSPDMARRAEATGKVLMEAEPGGHYVACTMKIYKNRFCKSFYKDRLVKRLFQVRP